MQKEQRQPLGQASIRNIDQTPGSYVQALSWVREGLCFKSYNLYSIPAGKAPWPLHRLLPFGGLWEEMEVVKRQEESALRCTKKTQVGAK